MLAKEITRLLIERIDVKALRKVVPGQQKDFGSIKTLEKLLDSLGHDGRSITAPLAMVYELRKADAHLPSDKLAETLQISGISYSENSVHLCFQVIASVCKSLLDIIRSLPPEQKSE